MSGLRAQKANTTMHIHVARQHFVSSVRRARTPLVSIDSYRKIADSNIDKGKSLKNHHVNDAPSIFQGKESNTEMKSKKKTTTETRLHLRSLSLPHLLYLSEYDCLMGN